MVPPVISLERLKQKNHEFEVRLDNISGLRSEKEKM
jgi:hypothetical protein